MRLRRLIAVGATVAALGLGFAHAQEGVPAENRALLLLRALAYDRKLPDKATGDVVVGVLYRRGSGDACQKEMTTALTSAASKSTVAGKTPKAVAVPFTSGSLAEDVAASRAVSLYVCPGLEEDIPAITKLSRSRSLLTFTGSESFVDAGVSVGFVLRGTKAAIVVNLPAAKAEGADLDAALLARAEVRK